MAGMPPLSGFLGKIAVLQASYGVPEQALIWAVILVTSLVAIMGFARAGGIIFWKTLDPQEPDDVSDTDLHTDLTEAKSPIVALPFVACFGLLAGLVALTIFAGPALQYSEATAAQLFDPSGYIDAVLGGAEK